MEIFCVKIKKPARVLCFDITVGGGPMRPPSGDAVRFPPIYGDFAMTTAHRLDIWLKFP